MRLDADEDIRQIGLRIEVVGFTGDDQGHENGEILGAGIMSSEEIILAPQGDQA